MQYRRLISETLINPFGHPYVIIDKDMRILGVSGSSKAPVFTSPPVEGARLDQILHPYIKSSCTKLLEQAIDGDNQPTEFIQLTGGYICQMQMLEVSSSENGQAFVCFFGSHHLKSILRPGASSSLTTGKDMSNGSLTDNIYNKAFHSAPMPLAIFKLRDCSMLEVNDAFLKLGGYNRNEIIGTNALNLGFWIDDQDPRRIALLLKNSSFVHNLEVRFRIKNGRAIDTILNLDLVEVNGDQCVVAVAQDITGIKRTEARLKNNEQLLISINENLMKEFIGALQRMGSYMSTKRLPECLV